MCLPLFLYGSPCLYTVEASYNVGGSRAKAKNERTGMQKYNAQSVTSYTVFSVPLSLDWSRCGSFN
jgi:hypothetical protein